MIKSLTVKGFKSFEKETTFPLSSINLLTGINGRGKSSFLQILLLCKQSLEIQSSDLKKIYLNGKFIQLGTFEEIKNFRLSNTKEISFTYELANNVFQTLSLLDCPNDDMTAELRETYPSNLNFLKKLIMLRQID